MFILRLKKLNFYLNKDGRNEVIENTFNFVEHIIEVRVDSIKMEFDTLLRPFRQMKHSKITNKWYIFEKFYKNIKVEKKEKVNEKD